MAGISSKLSMVKFSKGAFRRDRRSDPNMYNRVARHALKKAVRREGKKQAREF